MRRDRFGQRTAVADARRAAVAHEVETQLGEIRVRARRVEILGHDLRAGARLVFTHGFASGPLDRVLRQQAGADHHARIRRVRAARDRRNHDRAVIQPFDPGRLRRRRRPIAPPWADGFTDRRFAFARAPCIDGSAC